MPRVEIRETSKGIFAIFIVLCTEPSVPLDAKSSPAEQIGTIHFGTETNTEDATLIHINLQPTLWGSRYNVTEASVKDTGTYIMLQRPRPRYQ